MVAVVTDVHYRMSAALIRDLAEAGVRVIACETDEFSAPLGFSSKAVTRTVTLPQQGLTDGLYDLCRQIAEGTGEKPALLPVGAKTLQAVADERARFEEVCGLCIPSPQQLMLLNDKAAVHRLAKSVGVPVPEIYAPAEGQSLSRFVRSVPLPCVVKPLCGEQFGLPAAKRYVIAKTPEALENAYAQFCALTGQAPLVQQYLPGDGLGCSVLAKDGKILCAISHRRLREYPVTGGPSSCCKTEKSALLLPLVEPLVAACGLNGLAMFEFKEDADGEAHLLECNPRIWGTFPLTRAAGTNFSYCWFCCAAGLPVPEYIRPKTVRMVFYPSDLAAALGYLRQGSVKKFFAAIADYFRPGVKNGLYEKNDPKPSRVYRKALRKRRKLP